MARPQANEATRPSSAAPWSSNSEDWGQFLRDVRATTAILDRFLQYAEIRTHIALAPRTSIADPPDRGLPRLQQDDILTSDHARRGRL